MRNRKATKVQAIKSKIKELQAMLEDEMIVEDVPMEVPTEEDELTMEISQLEDELNMIDEEEEVLEDEMATYANEDDSLLAEIAEVENKLSSETTPGIEDRIHDPYSEVQGEFDEYDLDEELDWEGDVVKTDAPIEKDEVISPSLNASKTARLKKASFMLDRLSNYLEKNGKTKTAYALDAIADKIDAEYKKASRKRRVRSK